MRVDRKTMQQYPKLGPDGMAEKYNLPRRYFIKRASNIGIRWRFFRYANYKD